MERRDVIKAGAAAVIVGAAAGAVAISENSGGGGTHQVPVAQETGPEPLRIDWTVAYENSLAGSDEWQVADTGGEQSIEGYTDAASVTAGQSFRLFVSTAAAYFTASAYRMGWYGGKLGRLVWTSALQAGQVQKGASVHADNALLVDAPWEPSVTVSTTHWPPGCYLIKLETSDGHGRQIPITVRSSSTDGLTVFINGVTTWQAYNVWGGGYNLYSGPLDADSDPYAEPEPSELAYDQRSRKVSFDRPQPIKGMLFIWHELPVLSTAEKLGIPMAYATDVELDDEPALFAGARTLVFPGHDEYWSAAMRQNVISIRDAGTNIAFFGANTAYRHIRFEDSALGRKRVVVCYKRFEEDPLAHSDPEDATQQWRLAPDPRPESALTGVLYEANPVDAAFVVAEPDAWVFAGTGVAKGDSFPHLVGSEYDKLTTAVPVPRPIQVLSDSPLHTRGAYSNANSSYYTTPSGSGVFSSGTLVWGPALPGGGLAASFGARTSTFVEQVTTNILMAFQQGPAGRTHPARDNYPTYARPVTKMDYNYEY